ncbi:hypothetical protein [Methylomonas sp. 11b]|uniref:hypothetical protein n=1 Tax=Methylomonas sp. 11b TaxID=1168169 RepID=UPI0004787A49|nr:hypothetical protein [Methylomonas sp. 11b]
MKNERDTTVYELPLPEYDDIQHPHLVILKFPKGNTVDFGALCYFDREETKKYSEANKRRKKAGGRKVNLSSLSADRKHAVRKLIRYVSDEVLYSGNRPETVRDFAARFIPFMDWADQNNYREAISDVDNAKLAFRDYVKNLRERVNTNAISVNGAARQQITVLKVLEGFFNTDSFSHGINLIRTNAALRISTSPPNEKTQSEILCLCECLFESIVPFVTSFQYYPFQLSLPSFANYPQNKLWIFPTTIWFKHYLSTDNRSFAFNYKEGRVSTLAEIMNIPGFSIKPENQIKVAIKEANKQINKSNRNYHDIHRLNQGMNALNFFVILFLAETGMNWSQVVNLTWSDDYTIEPSRQLFRTIKWRANNKDVSFELPSSFMPKFEKFLSLRKYLLQEFQCEWLFFQRGCKRTSEPTQIKITLIHTYNSLKKIHHPLKPINARQWRAAKSDWLIRNTDPATTALILQNTEKTVLASYISGSENTQIQEVSKFLNEVSKTVVSKDTKITGGITQSLGTCSSYGSPSRIISTNSVDLDCKKPEGCLFCDKFKVHADEIDTRKLISCRYCIQQSIRLSPTIQYHEETIILVLNRINKILDKIREHNTELVEKIAKEVDEFGELDSYWARKLEMLIDLELIQ